MGKEDKFAVESKQDGGLPPEFFPPAIFADDAFSQDREKNTLIKFCSFSKFSITG